MCGPWALGGEVVVEAVPVAVAGHLSLALVLSVGHVVVGGAVVR